MPADLEGPPSCPSTTGQHLGAQQREPLIGDHESSQSALPRAVVVAFRIGLKDSPQHLEDGLQRIDAQIDRVSPCLALSQSFLAKGVVLLPRQRLRGLDSEYASFTVDLVHPLRTEQLDGPPEANDLGSLDVGLRHPNYLAPPIGPLLSQPVSRQRISTEPTRIFAHLLKQSGWVDP